MPQYEYSAPSDVQEEEAAIERADYDKNVEELASVMAFGILDGMMEDNTLQDTHQQLGQARAQIFGSLFNAAKRFITSPLARKVVSTVGKHVCPKVINYGR